MARVLFASVLSLACAPDDPPLGKAPFLVLEGFETTAPGQIPKGYLKTGEVAVVDGVAHTGRRSLRIEAKANGPRRITLKGDPVTALGGQHWGRLFFKVQLPVPLPEGDVRVIHSTLVAGSATSPLHDDPIEVRVLDTVLSKEGKVQYLYNVQPRKRPEFAKGSGYRFAFSDRWTLAEWSVDHATQTYRLFINGEEVKDAAFSKGAGKYEGAEIPAVFESLSFGWNNYQPAGPGVVAWIDDIALAKDRLGGRGIMLKKK
ncbi:MAG TPA: hypothetical protein VEJ18_02250 [Planctomycetota bacterium]|nr:hypothetical protein [Planctomycetota bacterium]